MKKKLFILAALAMIMASCAQDNLEIEAEGSRTITVSATMPETDNDAQTRVSLTPDADTGAYGITLKWETDDKLMLCFEHNSTYYHNDAPIVASSISSDGKSAGFTITIPDEIPADATFNLYGVYQKTNERTGTNGGYFVDGTKKYVFEDSEEECITLDKLGKYEIGKARPMLYFSQTNIVKSSIAPFNLQHSGWMMALHFKNSSGAEINLPTKIKLINTEYEEWAWNGIPGYNKMYFDVATQAFSYRSGKEKPGYDLYFKINELGWNWLPLHGQTLADDESIVFYRWITSLSEVPELIGETFIANVSRITPTKIAAKTVTNGKIYHVYSEWDGTNYKFVSAY